MITNDDIKFYRIKEEFGCFSNFSRHPFQLDYKVWPTSEHYYQAMKFEGTKHVEEIRLMATPRMAADAGRERTRPLRRDWDEVKDDIMFACVMAKFAQNDKIKQILSGTIPEMAYDSCRWIWK
jgi:ribA/ribD-fused uncharacterized protein